MKIVTTPMCEPILKWAGIKDYIVNKNPDEEEADWAILLSETETKMKSIKLKLNTFAQIQNSLNLIKDFYKNEIKDSKRFNLENSKFYSLEIDDNFFIDSKWLDEIYLNKARKINGKLKVQVYSNFIKDIIEDMGFQVVKEKPDFVIYPDYLEEELLIKLEGIPSIKIPSHGNTSLNPIERAEYRYNLLEKKICMKL